MRTLMVTGLLIAVAGAPSAAQGFGPQPARAAARHVMVSDVRLERAATGSYWCGAPSGTAGRWCSTGVYPRVWASFHGTDGALLFEDYDYLATALPIGQRRSFEILLLAPRVADGWEYYQLGFTVGERRPVRCAGCSARRR